MHVMRVRTPAIFLAVRILYVVGIVAIIVSMSASLAAADGGPQIYTTSGTFTVPANASTITAYLWGAGGADGSYRDGGIGGGGGYTTGTFAVHPGDVLTIIVGGGGHTGTYTGGGGGRSGVVYNGTELLTAGGGGGAGANLIESGAGGGGMSGQTALSSTGAPGGCGGTGGTQTTGGTSAGGGGAGTYHQGGKGQGGGSPGPGGYPDGGYGYDVSGAGGGGGGGGGFYGGGGGADGCGGADGAGGGGGSGYVGGSVTSGTTVASTGQSPAQTSSPYYQSGVGMGGSAVAGSWGSTSGTNGKDGEVAITWTNPPPTCSVSLNPNPINAGQSSTLSYTSSYASWMYINGVGYMTPNTTGSFSVAPSTTTTYTCTVADSSGNQYNFPANATLTVNQPPQCTLAVSPSSITKGQSATLTYSSQNVTSFSITPSVGTVTQNNTNTAQVAPTTSTTYQGSASGPGGSASCTVPAGSTNTVTVSCTPATSYACTGSGGNIITQTSTSSTCVVTSTNAPACTSPYFCSNGSSSCLSSTPTFNQSGTEDGHLHVLPLLVPTGTTATAYWNVGNVQSCTVTSTNGDSWSGLTSNTNGNTSKPISQQTVFTLTCQALQGATPSSFTEMQTVNVVPVFNEQ